MRTFIPGDGWLYYKIYTGEKTSDRVLTEVIRPVASSLVGDKVIDRWFFIRYGDPKHHLRLRFRLIGETAHIPAVIDRLHPHFKNLTAQGLIWKIQLDTYRRELERYGKNTMDLAETLFFHDSVMMVDFLDMIEGEEGEELRWLFGLRAIDGLLGSFGYGEEQKRDLLERLRTNFGKEFGMGRPLKKQLDDKFRKERKKIAEFMAFGTDDNPEYAPILEVLSQKAIGIKPIVRKILKHRDSKTLQVPLDDLMGSYIHMLMNRLFKSKNRLHEMVCYDFLHRYYHSAVMRKKYVKKP